MFFTITIKPIIRSDGVSFEFRITGPVNDPDNQFDIQINYLRKHLENTLKFTFNFVAFLVSLRIYLLNKECLPYKARVA